MIRGTAIVLVVCLVSTLVIAAALFGVTAVDGLQLGWDGRQFDYVSLLDGGSIIICNPSSFGISIDGYEIHIVHQTQTGIFEATDLYIPAGTTVSAELRVRDQQALQAGLGMTGGKTPSSADQIAFEPSTHIRAKIFGLVPITMSDQYTSEGFVRMINSDVHCDA